MTHTPEPMAVYSNFSELLLTGIYNQDETINHDEEDYGCNFVSRPPPDLICRICNLVLRDPHQTLCCGNHYCGYCLQLQLKANKECAFCSSRQVRSFRDVNVTRRVNKLCIKCPYQDRGCGWSGKMLELSSHIPLCAVSPCVCKACGLILSKKDLSEHERSICTKRTVQCPHCKQYVATFEKVRDVHWRTCLHFPIPCPNGCSKCFIPRKDVLKHLKHECNLKTRFTELSAELDRVKTQLSEKTSEIEQLRMKQLPNGSNQSSLEEDNIQLIARITEMQSTRAEDEHEKHCLREDIESRDGKIKDLETQNANLKKSLHYMEQDMNVQLQAMQKLCETMREENESLEKRLKQK